MPDAIYPELFRVITAYDTALVLELPVQLVELQGIGMPPVETRSVRAPDQDGETFLGNVIRPRSVQITLVMKKLWGPTVPYGRHGARQELLEHINPRLGPFIFEIAMSNGDVYRLNDVVYDTGFDVGLSTSGSAKHQRIGVRLRALDPIWWGEQHTTTIDPVANNNSVIPAWEYIFAAENYGSSWSYPTITLTGPMTDPTVTLYRWDLDTANYAEVAKVSLSITLGLGETVTITTDRGNRQAVDDLGDNVSVSDDSRFSDFRLAFHPLRALHDLQSDPNWYNNFIGISATGCGAASSMQVVYNDRWIGI